VIAYADVPSRLPKTDWLVLACPLTDMTRGLIDGAGLASLPKGAHVVNVARGEVIVEKEFIEVLRSGHLGGAWLDVFEVEPLDPASPLWDMPNVLISPHTASHSLGQNEAIFGIFLDNLERFRSGRKLRNDVDDLG